MVFEYLNCDLKKHMDDYGANDENRRRNNGNGIESPGLPETLVRVRVLLLLANFLRSDSNYSNTVPIG